MVEESWEYYRWSESNKKMKAEEDETFFWEAKKVIR